MTEAAIVLIGIPEIVVAMIAVRWFFHPDHARERLAFFTRQKRTRPVRAKKVKSVRRVPLRCTRCYDRVAHSIYPVVGPLCARCAYEYNKFTGCEPPGIHQSRSPFRYHYDNADDIVSMMLTNLQQVPHAILGEPVVIHDADMEFWSGGVHEDPLTKHLRSLTIWP